MLRFTRLRVKDEVDNGLAYYRYTFLARDPADLRGHGASCCAPSSASPPSPLRRSSGWGRGSAATATAIRSSSPRRCPTRFARRRGVAFAHYLDEVHRLGAELPLSTRLVTPSAELLALAEAVADTIRIARTSRTGRR